VEVGEGLFLLPNPPLKSAKRIFFFSFSFFLFLFLGEKGATKRSLKGAF
jgi:hypothetical protein